MKQLNRVLNYAKREKIFLYWCKKYEEYYFSLTEVTEKDVVLFPNAELIYDFSKTN